MTSSVGKEGEKLAKEGEQLASSERRREARFLYLENEKQASFGKGSRLPLAKEAGFSASGPLSLRVGGLVFAVMRGWRHAVDHGFYVCIMKESYRGGRLCASSYEQLYRARGSALWVRSG